MGSKPDLRELIEKLPDTDQKCLTSAIVQILTSRQQRQPKKIIIHSDGANRLRLEYPTVEIFE